MMDMLLEFLAGILVKMLLGIVYGDEGGKTSQSNLLFLSSKSFIFFFYSISLDKPTVSQDFLQAISLFIVGYRLSK